MWNVRIVWNDILMYHMIHIVKYLFMLLNFFIILNKFFKVVFNFWVYWL
jgi:hypothetical protein